MKKLIVIIVLFTLFSCKKDTVVNTQEVSGGLVPDSEQALAKIPLITSGYALKKGARPIKDRDGDGIADAVDACPTQKETVNGYMDNDGCPDSVPKDTVIIPPSPPDTLPATNLPASFILTTHTPGNQGAEGSCAPFATAYEARTIEWHRTTGQWVLFSSEYVYNQTKFSDCSGGTSIVKCLDLMVLKGVCTNSTMPYSDQNGCSLLPTTVQDAEALNYRISGYSKIYSTDRQAIKQMITKGKPVIITLVTDGSFNNAGPGFIWKSYSGSGGIGHAVTIIGYDDSKNAYKVMNSWGSGWGDGGFSWIDYEFFLERTGTYVFVIN
jgi:C1A family cysteine protease